MRIKTRQHPKYIQKRAMHFGVTPNQIQSMRMLAHKFGLNRELAVADLLEMVRSPHKDDITTYQKKGVDISKMRFRKKAKSYYMQMIDCLNKCDDEDFDYLIQNQSRVRKPMEDSIYKTLEHFSSFDDGERQKRIGGFTKNLVKLFNHHINDKLDKLKASN